MTLYSFAEETYKSLLNGDVPLNEQAIEVIKKIDFDTIIADDDLCLKLIQAALEFKSSVSRENRHRASHILVTWLLGIGVSRKYMLQVHESGFGNLYYSNLWLQSAMLHDYGYLCNEIKDDNLSIENLTEEYNLLSDRYGGDLDILDNMSKKEVFSHFFSYSYDEIKNYFYYSKDYHIRNKNNNEKNDHGIVGGCIAFRKYCENARKSKSIEPSPVITQIQKLACYIAASHNIYKSSSIEKDNDYLRFNLDRLLSNAPVIINGTNGILFLLSLVDTIECTKRFSAKSNSAAYLIQTTTLKYVDITFTSSSLVVDYSNLNKYLLEKRSQNPELLETLKKHVNGVFGLSSWTSFITHKVDSKNDYAIAIEFPA